MTQYRTNNPLGSMAPRDLYDNAQNIDNWSNGEEPFYEDRFGKLRRSFSGMNFEFEAAQVGRDVAFDTSLTDKESRFQAFLVSSGYVSKGDYAADVVLAERNEYVAVDAATSGTSPGLYRPNASATLPLTLTGTWATDLVNLVLLGDDVLRQDMAGDDGAALVGYSPDIVYPSGTVGAAISAVPYVRPQDFDPLAGNDDGRDDTAAVQAAIDDGRAVDLGTGFNYRCSRLVGRSNLQMRGNSTLDFSGNESYANVAADPLFKIWGSAGPVILCSADVASGAMSLTVASTGGISPGDLIEVATPSHSGGFEDTSTTVHNGEIVQVAAVPSGTSLLLAEPILDASGYTTANGAQIRKLNTVDDVVIGSGITIRGKGRPQPSGAGDGGISILYGRRPKVHCNFDRVDFASLRFEGCYDYEASGGSVVMDAQGVNTNINYGIVPSGSSKHGRVFDYTMHNMRHGVVTSHLSSSLGLSVFGVVRDLDVYGNTFCNTWHAACATHNDAEFVDFHNNTMIGCAFGVNLRERNCKARNNTMIRCGQAVYLSARPIKIEVTGNIAYQSAGNLVYAIPDGTRDLTDLTISRNEAIGGSGGVFLSLGAPASGHRRINISDNIFREVAGAGGNAALVRINGAPIVDSLVHGNAAYGCTGISGVSFSTGAVRTQITDNNMRDITGNSYVTSGTFTNCYGKYNFGNVWNGLSNMTNGGTIATDNTLFA